MSDLLSPGTNMALLQASQGDNIQVGKSLKAASTGKNIDEINEVSEEFEAVFLSEMLKPMFQELKTDGMFGGGKGEEVFRSFLLKEYGDIMTQAGGIGLADQVKEQIIQLQEQQVHEQQQLADITNQEGSLDETHSE